jgi:flagellar hook assembly protein FlgD
MQGAQVAELYRGSGASVNGNLTVEWSGSDSRGRTAAPGAYLISATRDGKTSAQPFSYSR